MAAGTQLGELIGKKYDAPEVKQFTTLLGTPDIDDKTGNPDRVYYTFAQAGCELIVDAYTGRVTTIFLHSPTGRPAYQFHVALPYGLDFSMTREQVNKALRTADEVGSSHDAWEEGPFTFRIDYASDAIKLVLLTSA